MAIRRLVKFEESFRARGLDPTLYGTFDEEGHRMCTSSALGGEGCGINCAPDGALCRKSGGRWAVIAPSPEAFLAMPVYRQVPNSRGVARRFAITTGLREGYGPTATTHPVEAAIEAILDWMQGRAANGLPYLTGTTSQGEVVYAWPEGPGKAGGGHEPVAVFSGEVSPLYNTDLPDEGAIELLNELAALLGAALGQTRVYVAYRDEAWVLQAEQTETPTGETV